MHTYTCSCENIKEYRPFFDTWSVADVYAEWWQHVL